MSPWLYLASTLGYISFANDVLHSREKPMGRVTIFLLAAVCTCEAVVTFCKALEGFAK